MRDVLPGVPLKLTVAARAILQDWSLGEVWLESDLILVSLLIVDPSFNHETVDRRQGTCFVSVDLSILQVV